MQIFTPRERVMAALNHQYADRVPIDYAAVPEVTERLMKYFQLETFDELLEKLNVDIRIINPLYLDGKHLAEFDDGSYRDMWGIIHKIIIKDKVRFHEFVNTPMSEMDTIEQIEDYAWPALETVDVSLVKSQIEKYRNYAIVSGPWSPLLCMLFWLRGLEKTLVDMVEQPELMKKIIEKIVDYYFNTAVRIFDEGDGKIDIFFTGDDFASQRGLIISHDMFCEFFKPGLKRLFTLAKDYGLKVMMHSCGAIVDIIPDLMEIGADIINPIQVTAKGMDMAYLKNRFGDKVIFHGAIDQQFLLPFGTEEQVRAAVRNAIGTLGRNGGYILCSSHDMLDHIPTANILAMYDEAAKYSHL